MKRRRKKAIRFLKYLEMGATIEKAAEAAGLSQATPYNWRRQDKEFDRAWQDARWAGIEIKVDELEDSMIQRAIDKSDRLAIHVSEKLRPDRWGKKIEHEHTIKRLEWGNLFRSSRKS